jgi:hypothetical protein
LKKNLFIHVKFLNLENKTYLCTVNVMSVDAAPMNKNKGTLSIAEWLYLYFIPSV